MVNLLKNNSTQGLYLTEDQGGSVAADTPGEIDLDLVGTVGDNWIYFDTILRFEEKSTYNKESDDFVGFKTWNVADFRTKANTAGAVFRTFYLVTVETDETTGENLKKFAALNGAIGDDIKYLVKQTATTSFEKFINNVGALKNVAAIIIRGHDAVEMANSGKDVKVINIAMERITERT